MIEQLSDTELSRIPQFTEKQMTPAQLRTASWQAIPTHGHQRVLTATIDGIRIVACMFPARIGIPTDNTPYDVGWFAPETIARQYLPLSA